MTKHEALKDLAAVLRVSPVPLSRVKSGPAPLTAAQRYLNSNPTSSPGSGVSSFFSGLLPSFAGFGRSGSSGGSLLDSLAGGGRSGSSGSVLGAGLSPVLSGLLGLFGGGKSAQVALPLYSAPRRLQLQSGLQGGVVSGADSGASGLPRAASGGQPQVTLNIQALDTQSIMNRSADIAQAVRQAMLQSHPINDVVADL